MKKLLLIISYFFAQHLTVFSQDTLVKKITISINADVRGEWHLHGINAKVGLPSVIKDFRIRSTTLPIGFDSISDNPFRHGVLYAAIKTKTTLLKKVILKADLYGEYRGFSYGTNERNNRVLFPVIELNVSDTFRLNKKKLILQGATGQYLEEKVDEGLMVYNIDLQGTKLRLTIDNFEIGYTFYGDLLNSIGLNIDDFKTIYLKRKLKNSKGYIGISQYVAAPPYTFFRFHRYYNLFASAGTIEKIRVYGQLSYYSPFVKINKDIQGFNRQLGLLAGVEKKYSSRKITSVNKAEIRYYGMTYNLFHSNNNLRYREPATDVNSMYANTVGKFLYPLRKFYSPFGQWAVYTEYEGYRVMAASLTGNTAIKANDKLGIGIDYDINFISAKLDKIFYVEPGKENSSYLYPFFKLSMNYFPVNDLSVSLFMSNKAMNLDIGYPTVYLTKKAFAGVSIFLKI